MDCDCDFVGRGRSFLLGLSAEAFCGGFLLGLSVGAFCGGFLFGGFLCGAFCGGPGTGAPLVLGLLWHCQSHYVSFTRNPISKTLMIGYQQ